MTSSSKPAGSLPRASPTRLPRSSTSSGPPRGAATGRSSRPTGASPAGSAAPARSRPSSVRRSALADREPRLARMEGGCAVEGVVEVLIEPFSPLLLVIVGESPAARTAGALARTVGWRVRDDGVEGADAVVVATMGHGDEELLASALDSRPATSGSSASAKRAATVLAELRARARTRSPSCASAPRRARPGPVLAGGGSPSPSSPSWSRGATRAARGHFRPRPRPSTPSAG